MSKDTFNQLSGILRRLEREKNKPKSTAPNPLSGRLPIQTEIREVSPTEKALSQAVSNCERWLSQYFGLLQQSIPDKQILDQTTQPYATILSEVIQKLKIRPISQEMDARLSDGNIWNFRLQILPNNRFSLNVYPTRSGQALFTEHWHEQLSNAYNEDLFDIMDLRPQNFRATLPQDSVHKSEEPIILINIFLPKRLSSDEEFNRSGWVKDFGPAIFLNPIAYGNLPSRTDGHTAHEAFHRWMQILHTSYYSQAIKPHPYLDESLAIAYSILHQNRLSTRAYEPKRLEGYRGLPQGMEQGYLSSLTEEDILHPLSFDELDGKGFNSDLYNQRLTFAIFLLSITKGVEVMVRNSKYKPYSFDSPEDFWLTIINSSLWNYRRYGKNLSTVNNGTFIEKLMHSLTVAGNTGSTDEAFWQSLLIGANSDIKIDATSPYKPEITRGMVERAYQAYTKIVIPLFLLQNSNTVDPGEYFKSFSHEIRLALPSYCPVLEHITDTLDTARALDLQITHLPKLE